jgi:hypothetical protein
LPFAFKISNTVLYPSISNDVWVPMYATCTAHLILFDLISLLIQIIEATRYVVFSIRPLIPFAGLGYFFRNKRPIFTVIYNSRYKYNTKIFPEDGGSGPMASLHLFRTPKDHVSVTKAEFKPTILFTERTKVRRRGINMTAIY